MWSTLAIATFFCLSSLPLGECTFCYQCDSWEHLDCGEDDTLYDKDREFLTPCSPLVYSASGSQSSQYQSAPNVCLKEVTYFLHDKNSQALDPNHRYNRPHVLRHCGISLNANLGYQQRGGEDYSYDRCIKTEAVVQGIKAERWICSCTGDGCNGALKASILSFSLFLTGLTLAHLL